MTERREPTISNYNPSKDNNGRPGATRPKQTAQRPGASAAARSPAARPVVVHKSKLAPWAMLFALVALIVAGALYWQLHQTQKFLEEADARVADLESKFEMTDDEVNASTETIQAKLKWADSEIRKLWGVAYDTNRKAIAANKSAVEVAAKDAKEAKSAVDSALKKATASIQTELKLLNDLVDAQQASLNSIEEQNQSLVRSSQELTDKFNLMQTSTDELKRRIERNEQAIEAIDAFRRNVNQQLLELRAR